MLREVTLLVAQNQAESLGDALIDSGALSITLEDADADNADEEPLYGEPGLEPTTCAPAPASAPALRSSLTKRVIRLFL